MLYFEFLSNTPHGYFSRPKAICCSPSYNFFPYRHTRPPAPPITRRATSPSATSSSNSSARTLTTGQDTLSQLQSHIFLTANADRRAVSFTLAE